MKLYKFKTLQGDGFLHCLDAIVNKRIFLATCDQMNDPSEGSWSNDLGHSEKIAGKYLDNAEKLRALVDACRFTSFTNNCSNELLWAHYAGGFSGIALEYDLDPQTYDVRPVSYCDNLLISSSQIEEVISKRKKPQDVGLLLNKSMCWEYEKEYRLFGDSVFVNALPQRIIFGVRNLKYDDVFRQIAMKYDFTLSYLQKNGGSYSFFDVTNHEKLDD